MKKIFLLAIFSSILLNSKAQIVFNLFPILQNIENNKDLYIDSTMTKNINGSEYIGPNHYDRNKNGNKISIVVTKTGIPIGLKLAPSNIHDINLVEDTLDNISI